jgi:hypothetical protein
MSFILKRISRLTAVLVIVLFGFNALLAPVSYAQLAFLPEAGSMVQMTSKFDPMVVRGIKFYPDNPFKFDFIVDTGDTRLSQDEIKIQGQKLASYFLASLTTPEKEMWVNLSPYEKSRIIPATFGDTQMGSELLSEDYILKQIMATALYPERQLGKEFWAKVYAQAAREFGTTNVPVNTFNKVWIVPNKAVVYQNAKTNSVFVVDSSLKVMLEQDYLAANKNKAMEQYGMSEGALQRSVSSDAISTMSSRIIKQIVIPALEKEVNEGKNFSSLRQIYQSLILAAWYKKNLKDSILAKGYVDRGKTLGVDIKDKQINEKIYQQYLKAYRKGAYNYIKEDVDPATNSVVPRKYFSGGVDETHLTTNLAMATEDQANRFDAAMSARAGLRHTLLIGIGLTALGAFAPAHAAGAAQNAPAVGQNSIAGALSLPADSQTHRVEQFAVRSPLPDEIVVEHLNGNVEQAAVNAINNGSKGEVNIKSGKSVIRAIEAIGAITIKQGDNTIQISPENANSDFQGYTLHIQVRSPNGTHAVPVVAHPLPPVEPQAAAVLITPNTGAGGSTGVGAPPNPPDQTGPSTGLFSGKGLGVITHFSTRVAHVFQSAFAPQTGATVEELRARAALGEAPLLTKKTPAEITDYLAKRGINSGIGFRSTYPNSDEGRGIVDLHRPAKNVSMTFTGLAAYEISQLLNRGELLDELRGEAVHVDYFAKYYAQPEHKITITKPTPIFDSTDRYLRELVAGYIAKGAVDLRNTTGGLLNTPRDVANFFKGLGIQARFVVSYDEYRSPASLDGSLKNVTAVLGPDDIWKLYKIAQQSPEKLNPLRSVTDYKGDGHYAAFAINPPPTQLTQKQLEQRERAIINRPGSGAFGGDGAMMTASEPPFGGIDLEKVVVDSRGSGIKSAFNDPRILQMVLDAGGLLPKVKSIKPVNVPMVNMLLGFNGTPANDNKLADEPAKPADSKQEYLKTAFIDIRKKIVNNC